MAGIVSTRSRPSVIARAPGPRAPTERGERSSGGSPPRRRGESSATRKGGALCRGRGTSAIDQLNCSKEFRASLARIDKRFLKEWRGAVTFFQKNHATLNNRRNMYGGHFHDEAAKYAREHLDSDTVGKLLIASDPHQEVSRPIFMFAIEFVGLALTADREDKPYASS